MGAVDRLSSLAYHWRKIRTTYARPRRLRLKGFDISSADSRAAAAHSIHTNTAAIARASVPEGDALKAWAEEKIVTPNENGNNLLSYISQPYGDYFTTDFWLPRAVLTPSAIALAAEYFERASGTPDFYLPYNNLLIRRFSTKGSSPELFVPYHQDGAGFRSGVHMLNFWTMIYPEECGTTSPGLDLAPVAPSYLLATDEHSKSLHYRSLETQQSYREKFGAKPLTPSLRSGDILIFNERCVHRTSTVPTPLSRVSAEIRLVAANAEGRRIADRFACAKVSDGVLSWPSSWRIVDGSIVAVDQDMSFSS